MSIFDGEEVHLSDAVVHNRQDCEVFRSDDTLGEAATCARCVALSKEEMYLVCRTCGEAFDELSTQTAYAHAGLEDGHDGFDLLPESEAM